MSLGKIGYVLIVFAIVSCGSRTKDESSTGMADSVKKIESPFSMRNPGYADTLARFIKYFEAPGSKIPLTLCAKYVDVDDFEQMYLRCYSHDFVDLGSLALAIVRLDCMAGGTCEEQRLLVFDKEGLRSQLIVGLEMSDQTFSKETTYRFVKRGLLELKINDKELGENEEIVKDTTYFEYYSINQNGMIEKVDKPKS